MFLRDDSEIFVVRHSALAINGEVSEDTVKPQDFLDTIGCSRFQCRPVSSS